MRTAAHADSQRRFAGRTPGEARKPAHVSELLTRAGIPALPTRAATWRRLTGQASAALLAAGSGPLPPPPRYATPTSQTAAPPADANR